MSLVDPNIGRAIIAHDGYGTKIVIPSKKRIFITLFLFAWLGGWLWGESSVISIVFTGKTGEANTFLLFWLCGWTLGGIFAIITILWNIAGKEIVTITSDILKIENKVLKVGVSKEYLLREVKNFRTDVVDYWSFSSRNKNRYRIWGLGGGNIVFDYGMKTVRFAQDVDEAEANYIIQLITESENKSDALSL